jgi:hypothetical protein
MKKLNLKKDYSDIEKILSQLEKAYTNNQKKHSDIKKKHSDIEKKFYNERLPMFCAYLVNGLNGYNLTEEEKLEIAESMTSLAWNFITLENIHDIVKTRKANIVKVEVETSLSIAHVMLLVSRFKEIGSRSATGDETGIIPTTDADVTLKTLRLLYKINSLMCMKEKDNFVKGRLKTQERYEVYTPIIDLLRKKLPKKEKDLNSILYLISDLNNILLPEYTIEPDSLKTGYNAIKRKSKL